jgi:hypothetical protein
MLTHGGSMALCAESAKLNIEWDHENGLKDWRTRLTGKEERPARLRLALISSAVGAVLAGGLCGCGTGTAMRTQCDLRTSCIISMAEDRKIQLSIRELTLL